jgi:hypothetical protein
MGGIKTAVAWLWTKIKRYPQRAQAVVVAGIGLGTAFGLGWDGIQVGATAAFTATILAFVTEQNVTPTSDPVLDEGTLLRTPDGRTAVVVVR